MDAEQIEEEGDATTSKGKQVASYLARCAYV